MGKKGADSVTTSTGKLLSSEEVSEVTGLSTETLAQWRSQHRGIPYVKISRNCVRYRQSDLAAWIEAHVVAVQPTPATHI